MRCGSIRTRVIRGGVIQRAIALLLGQHVFVCRRCGWRGRGTRAVRFSFPSGDRGRGRSARAAGPPAASGVDLGAIDRALDGTADQVSPRGGRR
jgi:hypothetical protein